MDVKQYFRKVREIESSLPDTYALVMSLETPDGGRAGLLSEEPRAIAAKMIAEGRALIATEEQRTHFLEQRSAAKLIAEKEEFSKKIRLTLVTDSALKAALSESDLGDSTKKGK